MSLFDLLACPACKGPLVRTVESLRCEPCVKVYPIINGVPVLLPDPATLSQSHERELGGRPGYTAWKERVIIQSLTDAHVVLDIGSGNQHVDDPCIIRFDTLLHPYVDVVGDVHALPFRNETIDFAFAGAVFEHLRQPFDAAGEIYRVLRPGGYTYADCNFIFAYHGYPHHYFNASVHGLRQVFRRFVELECGVAPFQKPSFALESIFDAYLGLFKATDRHEEEFVRKMHELLRYPLRDYDRKFGPESDFRIAAGVFFCGIKQENPGDTVLPLAVLERWQRTDDLQRLYPRPLDISTPDNLMQWARREAASDPEIATAFDDSKRFSKYPEAGRPFDRQAVRSWPVALGERPSNLGIDDVRAQYLKRRRPWTTKLGEALREDGVAGLGGRVWNHLRWRALHALGRRD